MASTTTTDSTGSGSGQSKDLLLANLDAAVETAAHCDVVQLASQIREMLDQSLQSLIQETQPGAIDDPCKASSPLPPLPSDISAACLKQRTDLRTNERSETKTSDAARSAFMQAREAWFAERGDYEADAQNAEFALESAVQTAYATYAQKHGLDSHSRNQFLYFNLRHNAGTALQAYRQDVEAAGSALAGHAGELIAAYATYVTAIHDAHTQRILDDSTTQTAFWQAIEQSRDTP